MAREVAVELEKWLHYAVLSIFTFIGFMRFYGWAEKRSDRMCRIKQKLAGLGSWTKQPYTTIALIAVIIFVIGIILRDFSREASYTAFSFAVEIIVFAVIIDQLLIRGERKHWERVQERVKALIKMELTQAFLSVATLLELVSDLDTAIGLDKRVAAEMKDLAENPAKLRKAVGRKLSRAGLASFDSLSDRAKELGDLQVRYSFRFLQPELLKLMIDLETSLKTVCSDASTAVTRDLFVEVSKELFFRHLRDLLKLLAQAVDDGRIDVLSLQG
jgi:hypothetical protein